MEKVCPICNGLSMINLQCEKCKGTMKDMGRVQEYTDSYAGQLDINDGIDYCMHLFKCIECNSIKRIKISKINL